MAFSYCLPDNGLVPTHGVHPDEGVASNAWILCGDVPVLVYSMFDL